MNLIVESNITIGSESGLAKFSSDKDDPNAILISAPYGGIDIITGEIDGDSAEDIDSIGNIFICF